MIYFVSFKIAERGDYNSRYNKINEVFDMFTERSNWKETTSFAIFESSSKTADIADALEGAIDPRCDLVLLSSMDRKVCKIIGRNADAYIFDLVPFAEQH